MMMASRRLSPGVIAVLTALGALVFSAGPAEAQNRRKSWEVFIYFGQYGGQTVPTAVQSGTVRTLRIDPQLTESVFLQNSADPNSSLCKDCGNLGDTGPGPTFLTPFQSEGGLLVAKSIDICFDSDNKLTVDAFDPATLDECDNDIEAKYVYNARGIVTNGEVQTNDSEFLLGARFGYNITSHWEVEFDMGFAKQRLDMTRNLIPLLSDRVSNPADPFFQQSADFYEFTWANVDFREIGYDPILNLNGTVFDVRGVQEIPNVPHHRTSNNPGADIGAVLPMPLVDSERFDDVTDFVNRILLNPTAFRNSANQINIDIFSVGLSGVYNFNTEPDSRVVPYLTAGLGKWIRQFDTPYSGEDSDYYTFGGGMRFFVNEIFAFRAEVRQTMFRQNEMTISAKLPKQNLKDISGGIGGRSHDLGPSKTAPACYRDQDPPQQNLPNECAIDFLTAFDNGLLASLPGNSGAGGYASIEILTETDDFWEARLGFDVLLGGR